MVQIPFPKGYKPKKRLNKKHHKKQKKTQEDKDYSVSPSLNKKELEKLFSGVKKKHPAQKFFEDIVWGDVKPPTKFDKFIIQKPDNTEIFVKSQIARLAKVSAYIGRQVRRWVEEKGVNRWYKQPGYPFTSRLIAIEQPCKEVEGILARRLPALRGDFKAGYEKMLTVANQCDRERIGCRDTLPVKPIKDFRSAAAEFHEIVHTIHVEANVELDKLTKPANSGKAGDTKKKLRSLEGEWSNPMTKSAMMSKVKIYGYKKFNTFAKQYGLRQAGNRQLWQIRLDGMDRNTRQKFEKT